MSSQTSNKNYGLWKGKSFWAGAFDMHNRTVREVHTYEEAENLDFQTFWCFNEVIDSITSEQLFEHGIWLLFTVEDGKLQTWEECSESEVLQRDMDRSSYKDLICRQILSQLDNGDSITV